MKMQQKNNEYTSKILEQFSSLGSEKELARTEVRMILAAKIYNAMAERGIGKKQLADIMGKSPSVITAWLSGRHNFKVDTLADLQRVLCVQLLA